jgi:hypothetical protein
MAARAAAGEPSSAPALFDGLTTSIRIAEPKLHGAKQLTVAAWVRLNSSFGTQVFVNRGERGQLFTLYLYNDHVRMLVEYAPGKYTFVRHVPPVAGQWTHFAGTYDGQAIRLYVDGALVGEQSAPGSIPERDSPLVIGAKDALEDVVDGQMADVRVYTVALDEAAIEQLAEGSVVPGVRPAVHLAGARLQNAVQRSTPSEGTGYPRIANGALPTADGFRGIWYANQPSGDEYAYKYSGGMATYPQQHHPIAIYAPQVRKTFFVYGGRYKDRNLLLHMISYYDHESGQVARPRVLLDKKTDDAHDNPTLCIDAEGYLYIFSSAHGTGRPSYIHRSQKPYDIAAFDHLLTTNFSYTQPWYLKEHGFVFLHTRYLNGRVLHVMQGEDGKHWTPPLMLARVAEGHYQVSQPYQTKIGTAFNYHPRGKGLNFRTNLYYMESPDGGRTWLNVQGDALALPLTEVKNPALAVEYESLGKLCYIKCLRYTDDGKPVVLYLTSDGYESGPENDPRTFTTARWTGSEWQVREAIPADNNYDFAELEIRNDGIWQITGATEQGPQRYNPGGELAIWRSSDQGASWNMQVQLTHNSRFNHTFPRRPVDAQDDFYVLWADGNAREPSESALYFANRDGSAVFQLPPTIEGDAELVKPIRVR